MSYELMMRTKWEAERRIRIEFDCLYGRFLKCSACGGALIFRSYKNLLSGVVSLHRQEMSAPAYCDCKALDSFKEVGYTAPPEWIK